MAAAALIITAVAAIGGAIQQRKISKAQRKQNKLINKVAAITRQRDIKRSIAASRIQVAEQRAVGFQLGVGGSTAVQGATQGVIGDVATAVGQSNLQLVGQQFSAGFQDDISRAQQAQAGFQAVGAVAGAFTGAGGGQNVTALTSLVG
jgi:hypothetical protein